jgi:hypothetical protein
MKRLEVARELMSTNSRVIRLLSAGASKKEHQSPSRQLRRPLSERLLATTPGLTARPLALPLTLPPCHLGSRAAAAAVAVPAAAAVIAMMVAVK